MKITPHNTPFAPPLRPLSHNPSSFQVGARVVARLPRLERTHATNAVDLGTITKSQSNPDFKGLRENALRRSEKYALQNQAVKLLPNERVRFCLRHRVTADECVTVRYNENRQKAHYSNVQRCGSVWLCPICAGQISEGRRQELKQAMIAWREQEGAVYLLTLTNPHHHGDNLDQLLSGQRKAIKYLWGDRKPKEMLASLGKVGHIVSTEVTHGVNGWHPHFHILLFFKNTINHAALQTFISLQWQNCCKKAGLKIPSMEHGCDLRDGKYADKYVSKWGLEDEMTKGHTKKGREGSATPWDLLRLSEEGCERSGRLFQQYAASFKGKRQLSWSRGLKALLLVEETTDEALATETEKDSVEVRQLALEFWRLIKRFNARADFLKAVEMDMLDGDNRAHDMIIDLAIRHTIENPNELLADEDFHHVRAQALRT